MALDFVAGCIGGSAGVLVGHPFDTVKVRLQTQNPTCPLYRGTFHCMSSVIKNESMFGLYKGISSPLAGLAFINAIVFGVYGNVQRNLRHPDHLSSIFLAGSTAGIVQSVVCCPMELAKTRLQIQGEVSSRATVNRILYKSPLDCLLKIYKSEGIRGIFRGYSITIIREAPSFGIYFSTYECLTQILTSDPDQEIGTGKLLFAGGMSGIMSWVITYPIDVVKTRIQADQSNYYKGIIDCIKKSYKQEGLLAFTRGLFSTVIRAFPTNAATLTVVTLILRAVSGIEDEEYIQGLML